MSSPTSHPGEAVLLDHANGVLDEAYELVVATHVALCPICRDAVALIEAVGGIVLADGLGVDIASDGLTRALAAIDLGQTPTRETDPGLPPEFSALPASLRAFARRRGHSPWRRLLPGVTQMIFPDAPDAYRARLIRAQPGRALLTHGHRGHEITVLLAGRYRDSGVSYHRGDFIAVEPGLVHRPVADPDEGCLCLMVSEAPVWLTGVFSILNPFLPK